MDLEHLTLSRQHGAPIYLQLYRRYQDAIAAGKLRPGDRVPSVRSLASELNLARGTVEMAYQMLVSEGYFVTLGTSGTVVSPHLDGMPEPGNAARAAPSIPAATVPRVSGDELLPFQLGLPALDAFPRKAWARLTGRRLRTLETVAMTYPDPAGYEPLRRAIATYLGISRGIACSHEQVFVTAGYSGALELVCRAVLHPGDLGWYEDPGYLLARHFFEHAGMRLEPVPVDDEGLNVTRGQQLAADARFAVVTPTHQSPTGVALSLARRLELLDWASRENAWIIEDDYDSEFRYHGRPLPALKSLDHDGRVLYTGTFSKVLYPGLRLGYLVVPAAQIARFKMCSSQHSTAGSIVPQAMVTDFVEQGHFARHLRKMRLLYAERRQYLVDALTQTIGGRLHIQPQAGGIHVLAHLNTGQDDKALAAAARAKGLAIDALNDWRIRESGRGGLLMGFANFKTMEETEMWVRELETLFGR